MAKSKKKKVLIIGGSIIGAGLLTAIGYALFKKDNANEEQPKKNILIENLSPAVESSLPLTRPTTTQPIQSKIIEAVTVTQPSKPVTTITAPATPVKAVTAPTVAPKTPEKAVSVPVVAPKTVTKAVTVVAPKTTPAKVVATTVSKPVKPLPSNKHLAGLDLV